MQIKKDKVKQCLLEAACEEFMEKGFEKASIRSIVKTAGTTIGNFYNYFDSKETLFCQLVDDVYYEFISMINNHNKTQNNNDLLDIQDVKNLRLGLSEYIRQILPNLDDKFILLIDKSNGTKFSNAKNELIKVISEHFTYHIKERSPNYQYIEMGNFLAHQLVSGIIEILKHTKSKIKREQLIVEQILFTAFGVMGILQGDIND